jgi:hypothetical protein
MGHLPVRPAGNPHSEWPRDCTGAPRCTRDGPAPARPLQAVAGNQSRATPGKGEPMHRNTKLAVLAVAIAATPLAASARSGYLSTFNSKYGTTGTALDACATCHGSSTSIRNSYGLDVENRLLAGEAIGTALTNVEPLDSDGDTYTNIVEIQARSLPYDARSVPAPAPTPTPAIAVSPASLAFGNVDVGASGQLNLTVSNGGNGTLDVTAVSRCGGTSTEFSATPASFSVAAGSRATVVVTYAPTAAGTDSGCIALANNSATPNVQVNVSGTGQAIVATAPHIAVSASTLAFGTVAVGSAANQTTVVSNTGTADLVVSSVARCSGTSSEFTASPTSFTVAPNGSQTVTVSYAPLDATTDSGCVAIVHNDVASGTVNVSVSGTGQSQANPVVDADITRFQVAKRLDISRGGVTTPKAVVVNAGTVAGTVTLQLEGTAPDATGAPAVVYTASHDVTLAVGASAKVPFPVFTPTTPGAVTWTLTVLDQDPDTDVATAVTKVVP